MKKKLEKLAPQLNINKLKENQQAMVFLICVLIATALWFLNALGKDYTTTISYPVKYVNAPNQQFLANKPPARLELKVDAHGFTLLRHKLRFSFSPIILNLTSITKNMESQNGSYQVASSTLMRRIRGQVSNEIKITEVHPQLIPIILDSLKSKTVPVKADIKTGFKPQFNLKAPIRLEPNQVEITGPSSVIDTIFQLKTEAKNYTELDASLEKSLEIIHPEKTSLVPSETTLKIEVEKFTEKELKVPVIVKNKPDNVSIKLFPSEIKVSCLVGLSEFDNLKPEKFRAVVNYNSVKPNVRTLNVNIEKHPTYTQLIRFTEEVEYLIENK